MTFAKLLESTKKALSVKSSELARYNKKFAIAIEEVEDLQDDLLWFERTAINFHKMALCNEDATHLYNIMYEVIVDQHGYDETELLNWIEEIVTVTAFH